MQAVGVETLALKVYEALNRPKVTAVQKGGGGGDAVADSDTVGAATEKGSKQSRNTGNNGGRTRATIGAASFRC